MAKVAGRVFRDKTPRPGGLISAVSVPGGGSHPGRVDRVAENPVEWPELRRRWIVTARRSDTPAAKIYGRIRIHTRG